MLLGILTPADMPTQAPIPATKGFYLGDLTNGMSENSGYVTEKLAAYLIYPLVN